jgi:mannose-6-phosphate isomerase-like protein (cupin superfamily)
MHRHPYPELFVVESGEATIRVGDAQLVAHGGQLAIAPSGVPHRFTNTGAAELRLTAIHTAARFDTEWLDTTDRTWASQPPPAEGS